MIANQTAKIIYDFKMDVMLSIYVCGAVITAFKSIKMLLLSVYFQILFIRRIQNRSPNLWFVEMVFNEI